jgi:glycine/D-amino acid oxidase-like deaminating enzyme
MKTTALWTDQYSRPADLPVQEHLPDQTDVAIIGSGYTGLNAARVLAQAGTRVAVLEQNSIGWGASSRNGGLATPGLKQKIKKIFKHYGEEYGRLFWKASMDAIDLLDEVIREEKIDCSWERKGHVGLAVKQSHLDEMKKSAEWMRKTLNYDASIIDRSELGNEIGSLKFYGGLLYEGSGGLQPAKYVYGLAQAVANKGVLLCENTQVQSIKRVNGIFEVHSNQGVIKAKEVLLATNGYTTTLLKRVKRIVFPVGSYIIVTEPLSEALQREISPKGRMFYDSKWFINYFRLTPDGRMLWGGRNNLSTDLDLHKSANILRNEMIETFPQLAGIPITHSWTGQLGVTFDLMPHIGRENGVHYALGYGGHGLTIATYIGNEVGKLLAGHISTSPFEEIEEQTMFFYRNRPWFLPLAATWFKILDWVS